MKNINIKKKNEHNTKKRFTNALNDPQKRILLICMSYSFIGLNFILSCVFSSTPADKYNSIMLGIVMLCRALISFFDKRKEMISKAYVVGCFIMHLSLSMLVFYLNRSWITIALYIIELCVYAIIIFTQQKQN